MRFVMSLGLVTCLLIPAVPGFAETTQEQDCTFQSQVVEAVRQARIERIKERAVPEHIAATNPGWPERYNTAIPLVAPWVYEMKMRDVKNQDLGAAWKDLCLQK